MPSNLNLPEIKARLGKATSGPWRLDDDFVPHSRVDAVMSLRDGCATSDDYTLIAHAPTDLANLIAEVERLRAMDDAVRKLVPEFRIAQQGLKSAGYASIAIERLLTLLEEK